jgi:hypothetical protein
MLAVRLQGVVCRIGDEPIRLLSPGFTDVLVRGETAQGLDPPGMVVGVQEQLQVMPKLVMAVIGVASDSCLFDGAAQPLNLTIDPRMPRLGESVLNLVLLAGVIEGLDAVDAGFPAGRPIRFSLDFGLLMDRQAIDKLRAVVGQHRANLVRYDRNEAAQEVRGNAPTGSFMQRAKANLLVRSMATNG